MIDVFKTALEFAPPDTGTALVDTIYYESAWWLVARWETDSRSGRQWPSLLVSLEGLAFEEQRYPVHFRFWLVKPIPKAVLDGEERSGFRLRRLTEPIDGA